MRSLITGANGLIGSHLAEKLYSMGDEVCLLVRNKSQIIDSLDGNFCLKYGDITDTNFISDSLSAFEPERIFHFAAQSFPTLSWTNAKKTFRVNIEGTYNLLSAISDICPNALVIMTGSSAEYAQLNQKEIIKEDHPLEPSSIYGISKLTNYYLTRLLIKTNNLKLIYTRPFFVIGPRKIGDVSSDFARKIVEIENKKKKSLTHGNLNSIRDFIDIEDCIEAFLILSEVGQIGEVYNICSGKGKKINDLLDDFCKLAKCKIIVEKDDKTYRKVDESIRIGDPLKLQLLGWENKVTLDRTIEKILNYWRKI